MRFISHPTTCAAALFTTSLFALAANAQQQSAPAVMLTEDASAYTLSNGIVTARVDKTSGDLLSMKYNGTEMLGTVAGPDGLPDTKFDKPGKNSRGFGPFTDHQYGFWSHDTDGPNPTIDKVTIDPKTNGGARAEVSMKGISGGKPMGAGPGGSFIADIEIRYSLGRGDSGIYTYSIFDHPAEYPASVLGEARFCTKLADMFDWMSIGPKWNKPYPKAAAGTAHEDKYDFTATQFDSPAFGWSSTTKNVGIWFLNPSVEYLSGGPTKVEFLGHRDTNNIQAPTILNYWRSSHYGGAVADVAQGEHWTKVIGPFMIYANSGATPQEMFDNAIAQAHTESAKWPYAWVNGVDYPIANQRATVTGHLVLKDPQAKGAKMSDILIGLSAPAYTVQIPARTVQPRAQRAGVPGAQSTVGGTGLATAPPAPAGPPTVIPASEQHIDWQTDAKHYQFWTHADANGNFKLTGVRPGTYTLHAMATGVLGELAKANVTVAPGEPLKLGTVVWEPTRYGRQVWDIGVPNRTGEEFAGGDDYAHDGEYLVYARRFPNDVNYVIGKSDYAKDWFFEQVPHTDSPDDKPTIMNTGGHTGRATPWTITFNMPQTPGTGKAHLRIAIAGNGARQLEVALNDQPIGVVDHLFVDGSLGRNGIHGVWSEHDVVFDASLLKQGTNVIKLTIPAGSMIAGVIYDYLRLEVE
jgi:rhamnogalacturonan endolyase